VFHPDAEKELGTFSAAERVALLHAVDKLVALGPSLPFPHQSAIRGGAGIRELRPRGGRSRIRGLYGRVGEAFMIIAIAPEAKVDPRGFDRAIGRAFERLAEVEE
jgi:hypothetical protein